MATYYMDLATSGTGHAGTTGDPWSLDDYSSAQATLNGDTFYVKGKITTGKDNFSPGGTFVVWDLWDTTHPNGVDDPWRLYLTAISTDFNLVRMHKGVIYADRNLSLGTEDGAAFSSNMLIQVFGSNYIVLDGYNSNWKGCSFKCGTLAADQGVPTFWDGILDYNTFEGGRGGSIDTFNCTFVVSSQTGTQAAPQYSWVAPSAWPAYDALASAFDTAILGAGVTSPPNPGNGAPSYTGYATDPWGNARTGIGAFSFPATDHSVNFYAGANGSLTGDTSQTVSDGGDASAVTAVPDANYNFTAWSGDNTSTDNPLTLTNVTSDMDTTANFAIDTYAVNFSAGANGSLTGDTTQTVDHGSNSTAVTAVPDANYNFTAWSGDNTSTDNPLTLTNVASDMDTTANFAIDTYSVNFSAGADGSLTGDTTQTVDHGSNSTAVTAVPDTGATFTAWSGDNTSTDNPLIVTNVTADMDMTANYTLNTYTVDFSLYKKNQGDIVGETSQTVAYGGSTTAVRADPRDKYNFLLWAGGGVLSLNRTLTLTNVTSSKNVKAYFIKQFSVEKMLSGKRGGSSITLDPADGTNFSPAKFATRGMTPMDWNFPS